MDSKLYSLRLRKRVLLTQKKKLNAQTKLKMNNYIISGRRVLRSYSKFCSTSSTLRSKQVLGSVKGKTGGKSVKENQKNKPLVKKGIKRVALVRSHKTCSKMDSRNLSKKKSYGKKSRIKPARVGVGQNRKQARKTRMAKKTRSNPVGINFFPGNAAVPSTSKQCLVKMQKTPMAKNTRSNPVGINFFAGNAAVPSTSKQCLVKRSVRSKTKIKPIAKKAQSKKTQSKKKIKKVLPVRSRKRQFKKNVKKLVKGSNTASKDVKKGKNKECQVQKPSASSKRSETSPISTDKDAGKKPQSCAVCLNEYKFPTKLPCSHVFCFLCAKGCVLRNGRCALCRQIVPHSFLHNPAMVNKVILEETNDFKWFYEGSSNSWWQYDDESNEIIEEAFQNGTEKCDVMIAGFVYEVNLKEQLQHQKYGYSIQRRIKRAKDTIKKRGIAGIPIPPPRKKICLMLSRLQ